MFTAGVHHVTSTGFTLRSEHVPTHPQWTPKLEPWYSLRVLLCYRRGRRPVYTPRTPWTRVRWSRNTFRTKRPRTNRPSSHTDLTPAPETRESGWVVHPLYLLSLGVLPPVPSIFSKRVHGVWEPGTSWGETILSTVGLGCQKFRRVDHLQQRPQPVHVRVRPSLRASDPTRPKVPSRLGGSLRRQWVGSE